MIALAAALLLAAPRVVVTDLAIDDATIAAAFGAESVLRPRVDDEAERAEAAAVALAVKRCGEGKKLAVALDSSKAIVKYDEALAIYERSRPELVDYALVRDCAIDLGVARIDASKSPDQAFAVAVRLFPAHRLDPGRYRPEVVQRFDRVRDELARAGASIVTIVSEPPGAAIVVDGRALGTTPATLTLAVGAHWLFVAKETHRGIHSAFTVRKREAERLELYLQPKNLPAAARLLASDGTDAMAREAARSLGAELIIVSATKDGFAARHWIAGEDAPRRTASRTTLEAVALALFEAPASVPASAPTPRLVLEPPPAPARVHWGVAWMPFGIAQFIERRPLAGALFLVTEVALIVTNIACYYGLQGERLANGRYRDVDRAEGLRWTVNLSLIALGAELIAGAVEGELRR